LSSFIASGFDNFSCYLYNQVVRSQFPANKQYLLFNKMTAVLQGLNNGDNKWIADLPSGTEALLKFCYGKDRFNNSVSRAMLEEILVCFHFLSFAIPKTPLIDVNI